MQLTSIVTSDEPKAKKSLDKFNHLWKEIDRKTLRNQRLKEKQEAFFQHFQDQVSQHEKDLLLATANLASHLTQFVSRKSLSDVRRECLVDWIESELYFVEQTPLAAELGIEQIRQNLHDQISRLVELDSDADADQAMDCDHIRELLINLTGSDFDLSDEKLTEIGQSPADFEAFLKNELEALLANESNDDQHDGPFGANDFDEDDLFNGFNFNEDTDDDEQKFNHNSTQSPQKQRLEQLFKKSHINKMYKKLAQVLHPDKETDESKKHEKQTLMQDLSKAREQNDVFTIISMFSQYIPDADITLDDESLKNIIWLLTSQTDELDRDFADLKYSRDPIGIVWNKFGKGRKHEVAKRLKEHKAELTEKVDDIEYIIKYCTNLKVLNRYLAERIEANEINNFGFSNPFMDEDIFDQFFD
ncbi:hypothetical protein [Algibacillus agarilyticus]|uniref:hypothetical protein n=1 Tax=Algibacillus agarilyticus TaxID=2234133 RepID=UPI000DCF9CC4|nr:hypothetical protein [Algibacillus agarilyticus]